jgi:hypothetical protein
LQTKDGEVLECGPALLHRASRHVGKDINMLDKSCA